jgi:hypothetical protein
MARQCHSRVDPRPVSDLTARVRALQCMIREAREHGLTRYEMAPPGWVERVNAPNACHSIRSGAGLLLCPPRITSTS